MKSLRISKKKNHFFRINTRRSKNVTSKGKNIQKFNENLTFKNVSHSNRISYRKLSRIQFFTFVSVKACKSEVGFILIINYVQKYFINIYYVKKYYSV